MPPEPQLRHQLASSPSRRLRAATRDAHDEAESSPVMADLFDNGIDLRRYAQLRAALHGLFRHWERGHQPLVEKLASEQRWHYVERTALLPRDRVRLGIETRSRAPLAAPAYPSGDAEWVGSWHLYDDHRLLEIEPARAAGSVYEPFDLHPLLRQIEGERSLVAAADRTARALQRLFGYDRMMVYRFDRDWHGEVVAETCRGDIEPYIGLHYPASDIPAQARALYLRNRVRGIADFRYTQSPLQPALLAATDAPTDLSDIALRSAACRQFTGNTLATRASTPPW